ncbi:MAG: glycoside hydrolase family 9 protein, partial [Muribaculaceae bacterium]|nr:glycoside hydrolase family 9 protein [Muribaculaceae bacterium]
MKRIFTTFLAAIALTANTFAANYIRVNQMGYLTDDFKAAVMLLDHKQPVYSAANYKNYLIVNVNTGKSVLADSVAITDAWEPFEMSLRIYFSSITEEGEYFIWAQGTFSPHFRISDKAYADANETPLVYMRQQRCGYNPSLKATCHQHDGRLVLAGERDGEKVDVTGGWHDASDYLQYLT